MFIYSSFNFYVFQSSFISCESLLLRLSPHTPTHMCMHTPTHTYICIFAGVARRFEIHKLYNFFTLALCVCPFWCYNTGIRVFFHSIEFAALFHAPLFLRNRNLLLKMNCHRLPSVHYIDNWVTVKSGI